MTMTRREALAAGLAFVPAALAAQDAPDAGRWKIHEWGTFTALQNEAGAPLGWINTEDEPLPAFCHRLSEDLLVPVDDLAPAFFKGAPRCHPDVILRLETPVLYFHPPAGARLPVKVDLRVHFRGGWLTEYYPDAKVTAPGVQGPQSQFGRLKAATQGCLEWKGLEVGRQGTFPETKESVWTSPRAVTCAPVTSAQGESEQFLFYRGVAYSQAPILARRAAGGKALNLHGWLPADLASKAPLTLRKLWLADIRPDGSTAFRTMPGLKLTAGPEPLLGTIPATFEEKDYSADRLKALREEMRLGLIAEGLNPDEAAALLNTWDASYFRSHGLRLFFLVPRAWTDYILPLQTTLDADVTRVMIGRLELVTPAQRAQLARISATTNPSSTWYMDWVRKNPDAWTRFQQKRLEGNLGGLRDEKIAIPDDYLAYLQLGRFRNALVLDELKLRPTPGLKQFVSAYDLYQAEVEEK